MQEQMKNPRIFSSSTVFTDFDIYLTGEIVSAENYTEELDIIRNLKEGETVKLHLNGPGGHCLTAVQFRRCIEECQGTVIGVVEGDCLSAHTYIFLACHAWEVADHSRFMIHNYSGGSIGKANEILAEVQHNQIWSNRMNEVIYKHFLTDEELKLMIEGKDYYFTPEEVLDRCQIMAQEQTAEAIDNLPEGSVHLQEGVVVDRNLYDMVVNHYTENSLMAEVTLPEVDEGSFVGVIKHGDNYVYSNLKNSVCFAYVQEGDILFHNAEVLDQVDISYDEIVSSLVEVPTDTGGMETVALKGWLLDLLRAV